MILVTYEPEESVDFNNVYYAAQAGAGLSFFEGKHSMEGRGFFSGLLRSVAPTLKNIGGRFLKTAVNGGLNLAKDVISGRDIKSSAEDNLRRMGAGALDDVVSAIDTPTRKAKKRKRTGKQKGRGVLGATVFDV